CRNLPPLFPREVRVEVVRHPVPPLKQGDEIVLRFHRFGIVYPWESVITACQPCVSFEDVQVRGPMRHWISRHCFEETARGTRVHHFIEYAYPMGAVGRLCGLAMLDGVLRRIFRHVHYATRDAVEALWAQQHGSLH
ncbi:MAG: hypothetical protein QHJ73_04380, partial [Armatimonadota bacterium]|nr:hypothetical protein [Armatimonadota bacterium]